LKTRASKRDRELRSPLSRLEIVLEGIKTDVGDSLSGAGSGPCGKLLSSMAERGAAFCGRAEELASSEAPPADGYFTVSPG
jgi:hypothetical protein